MYHFKDRWGDMGEVLGHIDLAATELYTEWLKPQGLAAAWTVGHTICNSRGEAMGGFSVFPREGQSPYTPEQYVEADALVPHLRRAVEIHVTLHGAQRVRLALAEAIDRLPTGVLLLDSKRRVVVRNRGAERILAADDGFRIDRHGPSADDARENATLQRLIAESIEARAGQEIRSAGFVAISRPSGERAYAVMVTPLLAAPRSAMSDAVVALFVADPSARYLRRARGALGALPAHPLRSRAGAPARVGPLARGGGRQARRESEHRAQSSQACVREDGHESSGRARAADRVGRRTDSRDLGKLALRIQRKLHHQLVGDLLERRAQLVRAASRGGRSHAVAWKSVSPDIGALLVCDSSSSTFTPRSAIAREMSRTIPGRSSPTSSSRRRGEASAGTSRAVSTITRSPRDSSA